MKCVLLISASSLWDEFPCMGVEQITHQMHPQTHVGLYIKQSSSHNERQIFYWAESDLRNIVRVGEVGTPGTQSYCEQSVAVTKFRDMCIAVGDYGSSKFRTSRFTNIETLPYNSLRRSPVRLSKSKRDWSMWYVDLTAASHHSF